jgi:shikimate dehydrogenase
VRKRHLVGLIGADIGPSLTPPLHEREAEKLGVGYFYKRIDINALGLPPDRVGELMRAAGQLGYSGLNITHPCKQLVVEHLDELSSDAATLGAVNTVVFDGAHAVGHNTDLPAFQRSFVRGLPDVATGRVVLLGAGGAGAAVANAALSLGVGRLAVIDEDRDRAEELAESLSRRYGGDRACPASFGDIEAELAYCDGLIHATPTGMAAHPGMAFAPALLRPELWVAEVVYRPLETELLHRARELGCRTLDGGGMAVFQAALSFALFTGLEPDVDRMLGHFAALTERAPAVAVGGRNGTASGAQQPVPTTQGEDNALTATHLSASTRRRAKETQ